MLKHILSLTVLFSFLSLGLFAEEISSVQNAPEIEEPSTDDPLLSCGCKGKKKNSRTFDLACDGKTSDEEEKEI